MIQNKHYIPETEELSDEMVSIRVITEKGAVCMTSKEYAEYLQKEDSLQKHKERSTQEQ